MNILIVDDDLISLLLLQRVLQKIPGVKIFTNETGIGVIETIKESNIDLLFLDLLLSGCNGVDLAKRIRQTFGSNIYIIIQTAITNKDLTECIPEDVFDEYIIKPYDIETIKENIVRRVQLIS